MFGYKFYKFRVFGKKKIFGLISQIQGLVAGYKYGRDGIQTSLAIDLGSDRLLLKLLEIEAILQKIGIFYKGT